VILTGDERLFDMITADNPTGCSIWKDASANYGVGFDDLAAFGMSELRLFKLEVFMTENYPTYLLRERQDSKARYEVSSEVSESRTSLLVLMPTRKIYAWQTKVWVRLVWRKSSMCTQRRWRDWSMVATMHSTTIGVVL
jgi:hypothetical protein